MPSWSIPDDEETPPLPDEAPPTPIWGVTPCYSAEQHVARLKAGEVPGYPSCEERSRAWGRYRATVTHLTWLTPEKRETILQQVRMGVPVGTACRAAGVSRGVMLTELRLADEGDPVASAWLGALDQADAQFEQDYANVLDTAAKGWDESTTTETERTVNKRQKTADGYEYVPVTERVKTTSSTRKWMPDIALKVLERRKPHSWSPTAAREVERLIAEQPVEYSLAALEDNELAALEGEVTLSAGADAAGSRGDHSEGEGSG